MAKARLRRRRHLALAAPGIERVVEHEARQPLDAGRGRFDGGGQSNSAALDRYDPAANEWTSLASLPTARSGLGAAVLAGRIVVVGGEVSSTDPNGVFPQVELYDPETNRWASLGDMPVPRHGIAPVVIGLRMHVAGGATSAGFGASAHHDALELTAALVQ